MTISATLSDIRTKIRRLTASPSSAQLTDTLIDQYVNTFYTFDFPQHLKNVNLKETYEFYTQANIDVYDFPLDLFQTVEPPLFIAGLQAFYSQSREQFWRTYSNAQVETIEQIGSGDGTLGPFTATTNSSPLLRGYTRNPPQTVLIPISAITQANPGNVTTSIPHGFVNFDRVTFSGINGMVQLNGQTATVSVISPTNFNININTTAYGAYTNSGVAAKPNLVSRVMINTLDLNNNTLILQDDGQGNLFGNGSGTVNYLTGALSFSFSAATLQDQDINIDYIPYVASRPQAGLFYESQFFLQPVPDQAYHVQIDAYKLPTQLLNATDVPQLREWWQYLAYGAAMKILIDRQDMTSVQNIMPFYQEQQRLANRRTIIQNTNERTSSIYTEMTQYPYGNFMRSN